MRDEKFSKYLNDFSLKKLVSENKQIISEHIESASKISNEAIVSLVIFYNTNRLNERYETELKQFGYIGEENEITQNGESFCKSKEVIQLLKELL